MKFNLSKAEIKYLQNAAGVTADGLLGPKSYAAMKKVSGGGNTNRVVTRFIQTMFNRKHTKQIKVDGVYGPLTEAAIYKLATGGYPKRTNKPSNPIAAGTQLYIPKRPAWCAELPKTTAEKIKYYGKPGTNNVRMYFPYSMYYAGKLVKTTRVNKRCKPWFEQQFETLLAHFGQSELDRLHLSTYSGLLNVRKVRGGTSWSSHAFGCAIDMDAGNNRMSMRSDRALFAKKEYQAYWNIVYASGATSLGLERGYDYMHTSYTR